MMTKDIDVLDVQELIWFAPKDLISENIIIKELQLNKGNYRFVSVDSYDEEWYSVNLLVVSAFDYESIEELISDCQYKLGYLFGKLTIQNSVIVPFVDGEICDYIF